MRNLPALILLALIPLPLRADLIFLKDGTILHGRTKSEKTQFVDSYSKESYDVPKGYFFIDDGARRFFFSPRQVQDVDTKFLPNQDTLSLRPSNWVDSRRRLPEISDVVETSAFDEKWKRTIKFRSPAGLISLPQQAVVLNSYYAGMYCTEHYLWVSYYLTSELGPDTVRHLLANHPAMDVTATVPKAQRLDRRFRLYHFLIHCGFLEDAESELDRIERDFPDQTKRIEEAKERLLKMRVEKLAESIRLANLAGRRKYVEERIADFPDKLATVKIVEEIRSLRTSYAAANKKHKEARTLLTDLSAKLTKEERTQFAPGLKIVESELTAEFVQRLELFVEQAQSAARQEKAGKKADQTPAELLALAVTGWMLGNSSAEAKPDSAIRVVNGRKLVLDYIQGNNAARAALLARAATEQDLPTIDQMGQLLALMPPTHPAEKLSGIITEEKPLNGEYLLQLPAEYHHNRSYPVLIVLHSGNEDARAMMNRWSSKAREEGYILVAPAWSGANKGNYGFTDGEHEVVMESLLDVKRRFNVDSDRVFLFGLGAGATMAFDFGLSHPDLFAAVMPMSGTPAFFGRDYWPNGQYLPFYISGGDWTGHSARLCKELIERWIPRGYPSFYIQYKGRGGDWYPGEVTSMLDWMLRKRRANPGTQLGKYGQQGDSDMFTSMRATDNRFYWLTSESIDPRCLNNPPPQWKRGTPATMQASLNPATNQIFVNQSGHLKLTAWLARDARFDYEKPIEVKVNGTTKFKGKVKPSLAVMLDDFALRLDRQRIFTAKIPF